MNHNPLVSVIIPTYNRANLLPRAISSALAQTYSNVEIIVIDDGSQDNTKDVVSRFDNVKYFYKENGGQGSARNEGLQHASGTLIASLDSDDEWYPTFLEQGVNKIIADGMDFVFANWDQAEINGSTRDFLSSDPFIIPYFHKCHNGWIELNNNELRHVYLQACPSPSSSLIVKKNLINNGWSTKMNIGDDWYLYLNMILSQKLKAAFTLEKLWKKTVDDKNVYDGRTRSEVLQNLYIADLSKMLKDFESKITPQEYKLMQKKYVYGLVELAKHQLVREMNILGGTKLLGKSLQLDTMHAFKSIIEVVSIGYKRSINDLKKKKVFRNKNNIIE